MSSNNSKRDNLDMCQVLFPSQASTSSNETSDSSTSTIAEQTPLSQHISQYETQECLRVILKPSSSGVDHENKATTSQIHERPPRLKRELGEYHYKKDNSPKTKKQRLDSETSTESSNSISSEEQTESFSQYLLGEPTMYAMTMSQSGPNLKRSDQSGCLQLLP